MVEDSIAKELIFSWEGNKINGQPIPLRTSRPRNYRSAGEHKNLQNHRRNLILFSQSRKSWRRALKLARGTMNQKAIEELLKRVKV